MLLMYIQACTHPESTNKLMTWVPSCSVKSSGHLSSIDRWCMILGFSFLLLNDYWHSAEVAAEGWQAVASPLLASSQSLGNLDDQTMAVIISCPLPLILSIRPLLQCDSSTGANAGDILVRVGQLEVKLLQSLLAHHMHNSLDQHYRICRCIVRTLDVLFFTENPGCALYPGCKNGKFVKSLTSWLCRLQKVAHFSRAGPVASCYDQYENTYRVRGCC